MENMREVFEPICPEIKCCKISEIFSPAMVCSSGLVANMSCALDCDWRYDCVPVDESDDQNQKGKFLKGEVDTTVHESNLDAESEGVVLRVPRFFGLVFGLVVLFLFF